MALAGNRGSASRDFLVVEVCVGVHWTWRAVFWYLLGTSPTSGLDTDWLWWPWYKIDTDKVITASFKVWGTCSNDNNELTILRSVLDPRLWYKMTIVAPFYNLYSLKWVAHQNNGHSEHILILLNCFVGYCGILQSQCWASHHGRKRSSLL